MTIKDKRRQLKGEEEDFRVNQVQNKDPQTYRRPTLTEIKYTGKKGKKTKLNTFF